MSKQNIKTGAVEYATYVTNHIPQRSNDKKILYYFSGSLAMLLLSSTKNIAFVGADSTGDISYISPQVKVTKNAKSSFEKGLRPISIDVDVVKIDESVFADKGKHYELGKVKNSCRFATDLCPSWKNFGGTAYFDVLSNDRTFVNHNIASLDLENGAKIYIANPVDMMLHKLSETLFVQSRPKQSEKYEKDLRDLSSYLNGLLYLGVIPDDFQSYLNTVIENNPESSIARLASRDYEKELTKLYVDIKSFIDQENQEAVKNLLQETSNFNKSKIQNQPQ